MLRRLSATASLAVLGALFLGTTGARALMFPPTDWDVAVSGKQTVKWSFAAEIPEACEAYYGTASQKAQSSGTVSMTFASKKPIPAQTRLANNGVKFSSFNTSGAWSVPGRYSKQGKFALINGRPCGWEEGDPEPLSKIADNRECGSEKQPVGISLAWSGGDFALGAAVGPLPWGACPGVVESDMRIPRTTGCKPKGGDDAIHGDELAAMTAPVDASKVTARKKFSVDASQEFHCSFLSTWPGDAPLETDISASYRATFKPRD
jgi:hypothetical protein